MGEIVDSVRRVSDIMSEITAASQEQSTGIQEIGSAINQMDEMTQQNAALVEEAAAAAESLEEQADMLSKALDVFKLNTLQKSAVLASRAPAVRPQKGRVNAPRIASAKSTQSADQDWDEF
jgi:hypothetical protein